MNGINLSTNKSLAQSLKLRPTSHLQFCRATLSGNFIVQLLMLNQTDTSTDFDDDYCNQFTPLNKFHVQKSYSELSRLSGR